MKVVARTMVRQLWARREDPDVRALIRRIIQDTRADVSERDSGGGASTAASVATRPRSETSAAQNTGDKPE